MPLSVRAEKLALRVAQGEKICEAAAAVGLSEGRAYTLAGKPEFREYVESVRDRVRQASVESLVGRIANEGPASVATLVTLRDDPEVESPTRRGCANDLLDRNPETARIARAETRALHIIHFSPETVAYLDRVIAERPGQAIVDAQVVAQVPASVSALEPRHIDDLTEAYAEQDGA